MCSNSLDHDRRFSGWFSGWFAQRRCRRPADWVRGIRVADAKTGSVTAFIESSAEFVAADREGNVYGAEVPGETLVKYEKVR